MNEELVKAIKYSKSINELGIEKRIETNIPILVRETVAKMLSRASKKLPTDLFLQIDGGYRSPKVQEILWQNRIKQLGFEKAKNLVGNPYKQKTPPGHTTGAAVDVSFLDNDFKEINLSTPFKKYYDEQKLYSKKITKEAQRLRILLFDVMTSVGFAPHDNEYWHFSYGDDRWAKYYNKKPIYKQITNPEKYYYPLLIRFIYKIWRKIYKITNHLLKLKTNY